MDLMEEALQLSIETDKAILSHQWAVEYISGDIILQFDKTGKEKQLYEAILIGGTKDNIIQNIDIFKQLDKIRKDIKCLAWLPINERQAIKIMKMSKQPAIPLSSQSRMICLDTGDSPYLMRETKFVPSTGLRISHRYLVGKNKNLSNELIYTIDINEEAGIK